LKELVEPETAGDPQGEQKWVRSSLRQLRTRLAGVGHAVSPPTVGRLLKELDYVLHVNAKKREAGAAHPNREAQFTHIGEQRAAFEQAGWPIIRVDTKKKELIGNFKNAGQAWGREAEAVNVHDFRTDALGRAVPYGIYDLTHNHGTVVVGKSADTPEFAVDAIAHWWDTTGAVSFPDTHHLLILADGGGSNGSRPRLWKHQLQEQLCDRRGLTVTVSHYPTGCSKWNPIEHRLFSQISTNWAGKPLRTWDTILGYVRGTTTCTGLTVSAVLQEGDYGTGHRVSDREMETLNLKHDDVCPRWNYTLRPRPSGARDPSATTSNPEVVS
jgi:hypothetical protein